MSGKCLQHLLNPSLMSVIYGAELQWGLLISARTLCLSLVIQRGGRVSDRHLCRPPQTQPGQARGQDSVSGASMSAIQGPPNLWVEGHQDPVSEV